MKKDYNILARYLPDRSFKESGNALLVPVEASEVADVVRTLMSAPASAGGPLPFIALFATDERARDGVFRTHYVFGLPAQAGEPGDTRFIALLLDVSGTAFPSLAHEFPALALYEREIQTMFGLIPEGHPDPRSLVMHEENWPSGAYPLRKDFEWNARIPEKHAGDYVFKTIGGEGVYEIPVGPVHAGIIEPGHFRFSVAGEEIMFLEPKLGYKHKGTEKLFEILPMNEKVRLSERVSGDTSFTHSLAFCQALENLAEIVVPA